MKRLLAYLFFVLGLGLTFNVSVEAKSLELCWKSLTGDEVLVTKHKSWKPGGSGCEYIHKTSDPILYKEVNRNLSKTTVTKGNNKIYSIRKINLKKILNDYYSRYRSLTTWTRIKTNKWLYPDFDINIAQAEASQTGMVAGKNTKIIIYRAKANSRTYDYSDTHGVSDDSMDQAIKNALKNCNYSIRNNRNYYKKKINDCKITSTDEEIVDTDPIIAQAEASQTQKVSKVDDVELHYITVSRLKKWDSSNQKRKQHLQSYGQGVDKKFDLAKKKAIAICAEWSEKKDCAITKHLTWSKKKGQETIFKWSPNNTNENIGQRTADLTLPWNMNRDYFVFINNEKVDVWNSKTQIAKIETSQTQKVAGKVDLVFCRYALKTSESFSNLYSGYANLKDNGCNKFVGISTGYIIQNITPRKDLEISYKEFIKLEKNKRKKFSGLCYSEKNQDILLKFPINVSTDCNEIKPGYVKLSYVEKGKFSYTSKETQIAKVEPTDKPKKTNKQSKTKITKKIIKTDVSDLKVKDISTWEKNILEAIEKESSDPYCKLVDKKPKLNELKFKKNYCIKKSDILKLGKYKRFNTPQFLLTEMKNCKSNTCLADKAGKNVYKIFVQKTPIYHAKYPGDMIKGMVWFEILYQTKLKKLQKIIKRYEDQTYEGLWKLKKKNHESQIYSLIKLNNGRIKMRNALGFTVYNDLYEVIEGQWLLAEFLNKDKLEISKVKMTPEMFKRKELIEKYKTVLAKYKKKLDEEKNKKN